MTAHIPYQFDIPDDDIAAGFVNGEKALTFDADINNVAPRSQWYLSRFILLDGGNYTLKINGSDPFIWSIGSGNTTTRRVISATSQSGFPYATDFYVRGGQQRIDIQMYNVWLGQQPILGPTEPMSPEPSSCYVAFSIWKDGRLIYASTADGWLFDTSWVPDTSLAPSADPRLALPIWTIPPNWTDGVLETLLFQTEIFTSETDSEQRRSLAVNPRRTVEAQFLRDAIQAQRMNEFMTGVGSRKFLVPFWPEQWRIEHALAIGDSTITIDDADTIRSREFYEGGMLLLSKDGDPSVYEAFVYSMTFNIDGTASITFDQPSGGCTLAWSAGTRITPLYAAYFDTSSTAPTLSYVTDQVLTADIRFNYADGVVINPAWGNCSPLWEFGIDWTSPWTETFNRLSSTTDTLIAPADVFDYGGITKVGQTLAATLFGRDAVNKYRSFVTMARGRTVRFWMPTNHNDISPQTSSITGTQIIAVSNGYSQWNIDPQDSKLTVAIAFSSGSPTVYRNILSVANDSGNDVYTVDETFPPIDMVTVSRIYFMMPMRFDQDTFELNHIVDDLAVVTIAPAVMSAEITNMPPIDCWVTSQVYPMLVRDELTASSIVLSALLQPPIVDALTASSVVVAGAFPTSVSYGAYTMPWEDSFTSSSIVVAGDFPTTVSYGAYTMPWEDSFTSSSIVVAGDFPQGLISYTIPPESLKASSLVTSGTFGS